MSSDTDVAEGAVPKNNPLYDAGVHFLVSKETGEQAWEKVARWVEAGHTAGQSVEDMQAAFKAVEKQVKHDFKVGSMPSAWRSAKSVALAAVREGIRLVCTEGNPFGKTLIESLLKQKKKDLKEKNGVVSVTPVDWSLSHIARILGVYRGYKDNSAERLTIRTAMAKSLECMEENA